jgi:hypothetical protein
MLVRRGLFGLALIWCCARLAAAQTVTVAQLSGTVTDETGSGTGSRSDCKQTDTD